MQNVKPREQECQMNIRVKVGKWNVLNAGQISTLLTSVTLYSRDTKLRRERYCISLFLYVLHSMSTLSWGKHRTYREMRVSTYFPITLAKLFHLSELPFPICKMRLFIISTSENAAGMKWVHAFKVLSKYSWHSILY